MTNSSSSASPSAYRSATKIADRVRSSGIRSQMRRQQAQPNKRRLRLLALRPNALIIACGLVKESHFASIMATSSFLQPRFFDDLDIEAAAQLLLEAVDHPRRVHVDVLPARCTIRVERHVDVHVRLTARDDDRRWQIHAQHRRKLY